MPKRTTPSKTFRVILGVVIAIAIVFVILIVAAIVLWTGEFTVGQ